MTDLTVASLTTTTGDQFRVHESRQPAGTFGTRFMVLFDEVLDRLTTEIKSGVTFKVLLRLPRHLDFETFRRLDQSRLAHELHIAQASVSRALAELLERRLVEKRGSGPMIEWRLSLDWGWRGNVESYHSARRKRLPAGNVPRRKPVIVREGILWKLCSACRKAKPICGRADAERLAKMVS